MSTPLKSFDDLGNVYTDILLSESKKNSKTDDKDFGFKKAGKQKDDGPEAAGGFKKQVTEAKKDPKDDKKADAKKDVKKMAKESTDTSTTMENKKLSFDELYERAMNEGPDALTAPVVDDMGDAGGGDGAPAIGGDSPVDDTTIGGEEEVVDPKELFAEICALVDKLKAHYGIEEDGLEGDFGGEAGSEVGGDDIEDLSSESVETQELPDSKGASLQGKNNKVNAVKVVKGKADTGKLTDDPEAKALGDKGKGLMGKNNKVGGSGAQSKVGASMLET